ncbi:MAG TPA: permease-like cell division protein FtsX [Candidatus Saccharimonadales bacterium]|nr:permease-like cell division protein FtsX [Candidatus Saccharimonadales bacterium]
MKRKLITLLRVIRTGCINFVRNISLSIAATAVMVVTLTIVLFSIIANATFTHTIDDINDKIDISVYLKDSVTDAQRDDLIDRLKGLPNVESVNYKSKEQVLAEYKEENKDNVELLLAISQTDNPLPATIQIKPHDPVEIDNIKTILEEPQNTILQSDPTSYSGDRKEAIDKITSATSFFRKAVLVGIIVFAVISMLIIFNTIRMAIFNRRDEIQIMRLLGARPWYIRGPFIVETVIYGVVAAIISIALCHMLFVVQSQAFDASSLGLLDINYANEYFGEHFWTFLGLQLLAGVVIGSVSAFIATKRYLRVSHKTARSFKDFKIKR